MTDNTSAFLSKLQEIEDFFLDYQSDKERLSKEKSEAENEVADLKAQIEVLKQRVQELEETAEQSVKGINRVWARVFGN